MKKYFIVAALCVIAAGLAGVVNKAWQTPSYRLAASGIVAAEGKGDLRSEFSFPNVVTAAGKGDPLPETSTTGKKGDLIAVNPTSGTVDSISPIKRSIDGTECEITVQISTDLRPYTIITQCE